MSRVRGEGQVPMSYRIGEVAALAGVTVRTLHYYSRIGLLQPAERTGSGYRRYRGPDLDRLRRILFYRELGLPLERIAAILDDPGTGARSQLRGQHQLLTERIARLTRMVADIEKEMEADDMGIQLTPQEKLDIFGPSYSSEYGAEAERRWGDTPAWQQAQANASALTKSDWIEVKRSQDVLNGELAAALRAGVTPDSEIGMDLAERHRASIEVFYECSYAVHRGLGDMYLADERFTRTYEDVGPGLAHWLRDAIHANADRCGS